MTRAEDGKLQSHLEWPYGPVLPEDLILEEKKKKKSRKTKKSSIPHCMQLAARISLYYTIPRMGYIIIIMYDSVHTQ